ncbi:MAG: HEPN domain-containing protein [Bacteroidaceae bacterium]|nr:HEPN domain-containing protein [Bacteroidaceae bacterium]
MTLELDEQSRADLVKYRMSRSRETLKEADLLARECFYNAAVNRLYYACYYASVALLLHNKIPSQTHSGVKSMIGLHFVSKGLMPIKIGKVLSTLFEKRQSGDYDDFVLCDKEMIDELTPKAILFIDFVESLLK